MLVSACVFPPFFGETTIEYYFLENDSLTTFNPATQNIDSLVLQEEPWLTQDDIALYDWSSHLMFLNKNKSEVLRDYYHGDTLQYPPIEQPFVVVVNNRPVYVGFFRSLFGDWNDENPSITDFEFMFYGADVLSYFAIESLIDDDLKNNATLKNALKSNDLFHAGIEVDLDLDYGIHISPDTLGTTAIEYKINIQNNDGDNLYILDPVKAGKSFYLLTNLMPTFRGLNGLANNAGNLYSQIDFFALPSPDDYANVDYYFLIPAGEDTTLTLYYTGYNSFEIGSYQCNHWLRNPSEYLTLERATKDDGRIWNGIIYPQTFEISYDGGDIATITEVDGTTISKQRTLQNTYLDYREHQITK
ncbi:MAG: hypothetical protein K9N05_00940 [Candidatus Marinimicrobia bacterium]|nr:hypothetical protein [Candidatus Neomarinimicrobiota bacterium]